MSRDTQAGSEPAAPSLLFAGRVALKALVLFLAANLLFALAYPLPALERVSAYNRLFPGRARLPYGDNPAASYNLSLFQLDAMLASHELNAGPKPPGEYRVLIVGDSAAWGFLLPAGQTLSASINRAGYRLGDGRRVRAYNLGYPVMSLTKDLLILERGMQYEPDLVVWPLTLESFPREKQLFPPLLQHNAAAVRELIQSHNLRLDPQHPDLKEVTMWDQTLIGSRRALADLLRLQLYGILWAATGVDVDIPEKFTPRMEDLPDSLDFHELQPPHLLQDDLAFDVLEAGVRLAGETPILFINEPMFISAGKNSDIRYNFFYPRWAYDDYRELMAETSLAHGWSYLDLWDSVENTEFTNSAVHLTPKGQEQFAAQVGAAILNLAQDSQP